MSNFEPIKFDPNFIPKKQYFLVGQKAIIQNKEGKLLLLKRSKETGGEKWSLPGGGLEHGEDPIDGITREIKEETQLEVEGLAPYSLRSYPNDSNDFALIIGYKCQLLSGEVVLNWEHTEYQWLTKAEVLNLELTPDAKYFLERI